MLLIFDAQQQRGNSCGNVVTDELPTGAPDGVAILGIEFMRGTEPDAGGNNYTVGSSQCCGCALCAVGGGEGERLSQGTHNGGGCDVLMGCGCCLHDSIGFMCYHY